MSKTLTPDQEHRLTRAREVLKGSDDDPDMSPARLAYHLGACSWWLEDLLSLVSEITGTVPVTINADGTGTIRTTHGTTA